MLSVHSHWVANENKQSVEPSVTRICCAKLWLFPDKLPFRIIKKLFATGQTEGHKETLYLDKELYEEGQ